MALWLIEPRDPVIFRDGRPFNASPGARATTLAHPFPSTIVGAARTRSGRKTDGKFDETRIQDLLAEELRGPLLVRLDGSQSIIDWLFPVPADALLLRPETADSHTARLIPVTVLDSPAGAYTDLAGLKLVGTVGVEKGKPLPQAPTYWNRSQFETWLSAPMRNDSLDLTATSSWGPTSESRIHVSMGEYQTAEDGALFQTTGLRFTTLDRPDTDGTPKLAGIKHFALALDTSAKLTAGVDFLGGERRAVRWHSPQPAETLPTCPPQIRQAIKASKHCRLVLLTPGLFKDGYQPSWIRDAIPGVGAQIEAAAVHRYQTVSGWDFEHQRPKPTRRLAPAGSVYFLKLDGNDGTIEKFIDTIWMHNVSDDPQDRLDGFGLAMLGVWDGVPKEMEMEE